MYETTPYLYMNINGQIQIQYAFHKLFKRLANYTVSAITGTTGDAAASAAALHVHITTFQNIEMHEFSYYFECSR